MSRLTKRPGYRKEKEDYFAAAKRRGENTGKGGITRIAFARGMKKLRKDHPMFKQQMRGFWK